MSILVDRIETKEKEVCRLSGKTPLAIFKSRNENILVHIISAFPTKDLLVPVPAEDLPSYLIEQDTVKSEDTEETSLTNPHEKMVMNFTSTHLPIIRLRPICPSRVLFALFLILLLFWFIG